ncbi:MAG TPA: class I SAM-dependent methyltransferase [Terriglobales bacterium]|nr:class I SAM-dependent methyltransferase [Terriglobales bacterium]
MSSEEHSDDQGEDQRARWDIKYEQGLPSLTEPDPFFISAYERFVTPSIPKPGAALDLAGGLGRHALWLASRQWRVTVVELSDVAIGKLSHAARELNVIVDLFAGDAAKYKFELARFDLIVLFYHLDRSLFPSIVSALKPGGLLICKMSLRWDPGERVTMVMTDPLHRNELPSLVPELDILHHQERPVRDRGVVEFVGRK